MTKKETNNESVNDIILEDYYKLSIQVSLNVLSFCILDSIGKKIIRSETYRFRYKLNPFEAQKELTAFIKSQGITEYSFSEVVAVHRNDLFSLVPKVLFNPKELPNYLKYNAKILANDLLEYDEITSFDLVNVYVPFVNINNDIYDLFGDFEFKHHGTVLIETLLAGNNTGNDPICYAYITPEELDLIIIQNKKLIFFNNFSYNTPEDFLYYLMFSIEQLQFDINDIKLRVFGSIEEGDALYELCQEYIQHLSIYIPDIPDGLSHEGLKPADNYLVINAF
ncbi:MAG: DUF3822 family protein [Muriicola sp.]|nr:DUF3822 family protein [Muriicola sp.]NNK10583.1 DUF3822 family protein [Flavobacteriaceae bacterium]